MQHQTEFSIETSISKEDLIVWHISLRTNDPEILNKIATILQDDYNSKHPPLNLIFPGKKKAGDPNV
jgi:hypothetical protein